MHREGYLTVIECREAEINSSSAELNAQELDLEPSLPALLALALSISCSYTPMNCTEPSLGGGGGGGGFSQWHQHQCGNQSIATTGFNYSVSSHSTDVTGKPVKEHIGYDLATRCVIGASLTLLSLWTVVGSVLIETVLVRCRRLRTVSNMLVGNLALSDLLLAVVVLPVSIMYDLMEKWVLGKWCCFIWLVIDVLCCTTSTWSLAIIAFDRFTATVHPVWYREQNRYRRALLLICVSWLLSIVIIIPPMTGWLDLDMSYRYESSSDTYQCVLFSDQVYVIYSASGSFIIPLAIMCVLYTKIFMVLHARSLLTNRSGSRGKSSLKNDSFRGKTTKSIIPLVHVSSNNNNNNVNNTRESASFDNAFSGNLNGESGNSNSNGNGNGNGNSTVMSSNVTLSYFGQRLDPHFERLRLIDDSDSESLLQETQISCSGPATPPHSLVPNTKADFHLSWASGWGSTTMMLPSPNSLTREAFPAPCYSPPQTRWLVADLRPKWSKSYESSGIYDYSANAESPHTFSEPPTPLPPRNSGPLAVPHQNGINNYERISSGNLKSKESFSEPVSPLAQRVTDHDADRDVKGDSGFENSALSVSPECTPARRRVRLLMRVSSKKGSPKDTSRNSRALIRKSSSKAKSYHSKETQATLRMLMIILIFVFTWMPFMFVYILSSFKDNFEINEHLQKIVIWLGYANSGINPIIIFSYSKDFRVALRRIFLKKNHPQACRSSLSATASLRSDY